MKKLILFAIATTFVACAPTERVITGQVDGEGSVIIHNVITDAVVDTVEIIDGKFRYADALSNDDIYGVVYGRNVAIVVPEFGEVNVVFKKDNVSIVSGTKLNDALQAYKNFNNEVTEKYYTVVDSLKSTYKDDAAMMTEKIKEHTEGAIDKMEDYAEGVLESNKKNILGAYLFLEKATDKTVEEINTFIEENSNALSFKQLSSIRESKIKFENTDKGKMFTDFDARNIENTADVKLSDYVGKGQYVILDYWASWCPPCKAEMPNLKKIYDKYKKQGLVVLSVNVWDKHAKALTAIKDWDMTWSQIYASDNKTATDLYGVLGIPTLIVFDKDGTIISRELRGEELSEKMAELYK